MKDLPEIAPELRGLLEEIVADPRSSIRLAPKRALRSWFDSGETVRAREISGTKAERHLVEAHREALAALLCEASRIAYWKAPRLFHRPSGVDGKPYDPAGEEPHWGVLAKRQLATRRRGGIEGADLLRQCIGGINPEHGVALATASLSLVPRDRTRCFLAANFPLNRPRSAIGLLSRIAEGPQPISLRPDVLSSLGSRLCMTGQYREAREAYKAASALAPNCPLDRFYIFNLSCFLGDNRAAVDESRKLDELVGKDDPRLLEAEDILRRWSRAIDINALDFARRFGARILGTLSPVAVVLCQALVS